ncbi:hypothetical protein CLIB1444_11S01728 [[Candida] jaroonii]|uniref:Uncharacterized protein n=1 Tax=[Candida] jaroonii TaxID=467808 RepID=A0ACA9YE15_9ASCO|nr:hypothetical protein CLIB1444_11S01728 [[Candida] jaroonii]
MTKTDVSGIDDAFWISYADTTLHLGKKKDFSSSIFKTINKYLESLKFDKVSATEIQALMNSPFTDGDLIKTFHLIRYFQLSKKGLFITNDSFDKSGNPIRFVGADNWESVMCYMDSLLFSMFANLDSFEPILFISNQFQNPLVNRLSNLLRVYVNLLRSGNTIKIDLTIKICQTLSKLGFSEAMSHKQQDAATLFEFLTEILSMPLLTFKIDIKHSGKFNEADDRKYSKERMLFVSIPDDGEDGESDDVILLEECLEHYFNNSITVMRELERRATLDGAKRPTIDELSELSNEQPSFASKNNTRVEVRTRSSTLSIWTIDGDKKEKPKEVSLPAWMFLRLLPFYTDDNNVSITNSGNVNSIAKNSKEFANRRPVLPICLKRYSYENQRANRSKKKIVIPPIINLPQFVADEDDDKNSGNYKLILESAICHRGTSISSGHFVSAVRKNYHKINETEEEALEAPWFLYDDMHKPKVVDKSFKDLFSEEWPYMLFYRLISIEETSSRSSINSDNSKIIIPEGSKNSYWQEPVLSPILSATASPNQSQNPSTVASGVNSPELKPVHNNAISKTVSNNSQTSIPIPDISPSDKAFVDIRQRYYWYIPDDDMNYYKEFSISTHSTRRPSLTAQFRRNSQWSDTLLLSDVNKKLDNLPKTENNVSIETSMSNLNLSEKSEPLDVKDKKHHHFHLHSDDHKKAKKKRDHYKRDKCIIT